MQFERWARWRRKPVSACFGCWYSRDRAAWRRAKSPSTLPIAPATLSFHLKELSHAGLVTSRQDGRFIFYSANFTAMNDLLAYLTENCCVADCGPGASCAPLAACAPAAPKRATAGRRKPQRSKA